MLIIIYAYNFRFIEINVVIRISVFFLFYFLSILIYNAYINPFYVVIYDKLAIFTVLQAFFYSDCILLSRKSLTSE